MFAAPRLRTLDSREAARHATWLELFYDLVYVVVVAALAHELAEHLTPAGLLAFGALFVPVWWSWVGVMVYNDRFDTDDVGTRILTVLAMFGAAALAISIDGALTGPGFVLSYVFLRALLIAQYLRVAKHVPLARALGVHYAIGFSLAAAVWGASLLVPPPWRFALWVVAMAIEVGTPLTARRHQAKLPVSTSHLPERMGLFTIIVLGEAVSAVVRGVEEPGVGAFVGGALGLAIAFALWWIYFENVDEHVVRKTRVAGQVWFYAHLPLMVGIVAAAVGVESLVGVEPRDVLPLAARAVLGGGVALCLLALAVIHLTTTDRTGAPRHRRRASVRLGSAAAAVVLTLLAGGLPAVAFGASLALLAVAQVVLDPPRQSRRVAS